MRIFKKVDNGNEGKMCNVDQHASMIGPPLLPLFAFSSTWHLVLRSIWHSQFFLFWLNSKLKRVLNLKILDEKKPKSQKRIRQKYIKVILTEDEKRKIEENAAAAKMSTSQYARDLCLGYKPKSLVDNMALYEMIKIKGDMNKIGGLLKKLMAGDVVDPKEIRSKVNGLLLDFSRNQQNIDLLFSKIRSKIKL